MGGQPRESIIRVRLLRCCRGGRRLRAGDADSQWPAPSFPRSRLVRSVLPANSSRRYPLATAKWVDWFNRRRIYQYCGDIPPVDLETAYYARHRRPAAG